MTTGTSGQPTIGRAAHKGVAPCLIQDGTPRGERVPRQTAHANGATGIGAVTVAVDDVATVGGWCAAALGRPGIPASRDDLGASGLRFGIGPHTLEFVAPTSAGAPCASGSPAVARRRGRRRSAPGPGLAARSIRRRPWALACPASARRSPR